jgi:hypothetical protein
MRLKLENFTDDLQIVSVDSSTSLLGETQRVMSNYAALAKARGQRLG